MARNITYKSISKDLEKMVKPASHSVMRPSLGLEGTVGEFFYLSVEDLIPFRNQARKSFNEEDILSLSESIKLYGIRQPLTVSPIIDGKYEVISGERRLRAAKLVELEKVPCIILNDTYQVDAVALIENIHRKDLHPIELGITYKKLIENKVFQNQSELAQKISVNKSHVSEYIKYAELDADVQKFILENKITSRDKLRSVLKAHEKGDKEGIARIIGMQVNKRNKFSILRIASEDGIIKLQESGIKQLSVSEKLEIKNLLLQLIQRM